MKTSFIDRMNKRWTSDLGLFSSAALAAGWQQFEEALVRTGAGADRWQVLQLPTGTGKTEALKVLCAMQPFVRHPGVLIVTKLQIEATKLAEDINELAGWQMAYAQHGKSSLEGMNPAYAPVLIVTHAAYRLALTDLANEGERLKLDRLLSYQMGKRSWLVIDEAFDWIERYEADLTIMRIISAHVWGSASGAVPPNVDRLIAFAKGVTERSHLKKDQRLNDEMLRELAALDLPGLGKLVAELPDSSFPNWVDAEDVEAQADTQPADRRFPNLKARYLEFLHMLQAIVRVGHAWISRRGGKATLQSSRCLMNVNGQKGIILDATADIDLVYSLDEDLFRLLPAPQNVRRYDNVKLHVSHDHKVGKIYLTEHAHKEWPELYGSLSVAFKSRKVMICAHKSVTPAINKIVAPITNLSVVHWGNIDGRNDWLSYDTALIYGLPYLKDTDAIHALIAFRGAQTEDWFAGKRRYGRHEDVIADLTNSHIARTVVQAINRIRCRRPIDGHGNCAPTDIYLLLPKGRTGENVLDWIKSQMPGLDVHSWSACAAKRKPRELETASRLISFFERADAGRFTKSVVVQAIGSNPRSFERFTAKLKDPAAELSKAMTALCFEYYSGAGRGREAYFTKH